MFNIPGFTCKLWRWENTGHIVSGGWLASAGVWGKERMMRGGVGGQIDCCCRKEGELGKFELIFSPFILPLLPPEQPRPLRFSIFHGLLACLCYLANQPVIRLSIYSRTNPSIHPPLHQLR